jgi:hypothetical protein
MNSPRLFILATFYVCLSISPSIYAEPKNPPIAKVDEVIKIVTVEDRARLCPKINCGEDQELLVIPTNTELKVEASSTSNLPLWDVIWYKVTYKDKKGWVSEFDTDKAPEEPRYR